MTYYNVLPKDIKLRHVIRKGTFLLKRITKKHRIYLYQVSTFYVEVVYSKADSTVQFINSFDDMTSLELYLEEIDISDLTTKKA